MNTKLLDKTRLSQLELEKCAVDDLYFMGWNDKEIATAFEKSIAWATRLRRWNGKGRP